MPLPLSRICAANVQSSKTLDLLHHCVSLTSLTTFLSRKISRRLKPLFSFQLLHINHNLNMIRTVVEEKMSSNGSRLTPQPLPPLEVVVSEQNQPEEEEAMSKNLVGLLGIKSSSPVKSVWMSPLPDSIYTSERSVWILDKFFFGKKPIFSHSYTLTS